MVGGGLQGSHGYVVISFQATTESTIMVTTFKAKGNEMMSAAGFLKDFGAEKDTGTSRAVFSLRRT
jgi:hypothetical protein